MIAPSNEHKWSDDRPGKDPEKHDAFGRSPFAKRIADEIRAWHQKESLVISVNGTWGSGKTTLANFIVHFLEKAPQSAQGKPPEVIRFNPWRWSGQEKVMEAFFEEVGSVLRKGRLFGSWNSQALAKLWSRIETITIKGGASIESVQRDLTAFFAITAGGTGVLPLLTQNELLQTSISGLSVLLLSLATLCAAVAPFASKIAGFFRFLAQRTESLEEIRQELREELGKCPAPLVVVIDDVDRLISEEIRTLFQIIKVNADFPNVIYLLLYEKAVVAKALDGVVDGRGEDFLKKIVQVELPVPAPAQGALEKVFVDEIEPLLKKCTMRWDKERWDKVFRDVLMPYYRQPRDIKRLGGLVEFFLEGHINNGVLEVNFIDLVLLETLRLFETEIYDHICGSLRKRPDFFTEHLFYKKHERTAFSIELEKVFKERGRSDDGREKVERLVFQLFPQAIPKFEPRADHDTQMERELRICSAKHFPRYIHLNPEPYTVSQSFMTRFFDSRNDIGAFIEHLEEADQGGFLYDLCHRLLAVVDEFPVDLLKPFLSALLDAEAKISEKPKTLLSDDFEFLQLRLASILLQRVSNLDDRVTMLREAIKGARSTEAPAKLLDYLQPDKESQELGRSPVIPQEMLVNLRREFLPRLREYANSGRLLESESAMQLLFMLRNWAGQEECRHWVAEAVKNPKSAALFLRAMLHVTTTSGRDGTEQVFMVNGPLLEQFIDLEHLNAHLEPAIARDEFDQRMFSGVGEAIGRKGKSEAYDKIFVARRRDDGELLFSSSGMW